MTDIGDDYDPYWDDGYYGDERADNYEPDPADYSAFAYGYEDYLASLSPAGRLAARLRDLIWRHTWGWRAKVSGRWLLLTGRATTEPDEPPF